MTPVRAVDSVGARFEELHRKAPDDIFMESSHELFQECMEPLCSRAGHRAFLCSVGRAGIDGHRYAELQLQFGLSASAFPALLIRNATNART